MKLIINNRHIKESIEVILNKVKQQTTYLDQIIVKPHQVICTCPFHADGHEKHPACFIYSDIDKDFDYGTFHCFACGQSGSLAKLIGKCFDSTTEFGKQWLVENFGNVYVEEVEYLPKIQDKKYINSYLDESYLDQFDYDNSLAIDYLVNKRHLSLDIINKFKIGFEKDSNSITFPARDQHGNLLGVFKRNIYTKFFTIPQVEIKPIFLLDYVIKNSINQVYVVESQINALTLWSWKLPAIALIGTGSKEQYDILNKSGIRSYILAFDGDAAGYSGQNRFINNIKNSLIQVIQLPYKKDVNDLTFEQFSKLQRINI